MTDLEKARQAMSFVDQHQVVSDEDIFKLAGACKFFDESLRDDFFALSHGHSKKQKFEEKWKNTKPYKSPGMIFNLAKKNGFKVNNTSCTVTQSPDVSIYDTLSPLDEECMKFYQSRGAY